MSMISLITGVINFSVALVTVNKMIREDEIDE